ncbi:hypothetical protein [Halarcobacter ebronensis]|uniref:Uncharacterized protein n=1 Tax=Halarcobacter ebronensis TaxID=1462615 RepID=A0A4Q1AXL4_9BACT|nr:hypothetical protein [Halarcobacter ebronensis]QKF83354.1 hypothetical protein AEBR_2903 [Halarcobacter ebronensis]RXK05915.1 hypothetical protein CRV07_07530 [Halarcobacter ebronensis]
MIFMILVGIVATIVIVLNMMDSSNMHKIEDHFKDKKCENIVYSKGSYKGICGDEVMEVENSFEVDLKNNKKSIKLKDIKKLDDRALTIIINDDYEIEFKDKLNKEKFYNELKEKLNQ